MLQPVDMPDLQQTVIIKVQIVHSGVKKRSHDYQIKRDQKNESICRRNVFIDHSPIGGVLQENALSYRG